MAHNRPQISIRSMSQLGQTENNSVRVDVFRFALELGHCSTRSACLKRANTGLGRLDVALDLAATNQWTVVDMKRTGR